MSSNPEREATLLAAVQEGAKRLDVMDHLLRQARPSDALGTAVLAIGQGIYGALFVLHTVLVDELIEDGLIGEEVDETVPPSH